MSDTDTQQVDVSNEKADHASRAEHSAEFADSSATASKKTKKATCSVVRFNQQDYPDRAAAYAAATKVLTKGSAT
jgi:hypothetical protein